MLPVSAAVSATKIESVPRTESIAWRPRRPMCHDNIDALRNAFLFPVELIFTRLVSKCLVAKARCVLGCVTLELASITKCNLVGAFFEEADSSADVLVQFNQCTSA